jgi:dTDP-glucose 4,6-dehydratase
MKTLFVTGGAGFIGSALIRLLIAESDWRIVNIDKLTYAGNLENLASVAADPATASSAWTSASVTRCWRCCARTAPARSSTSRPRATSTARFSGRASSCAPTSKAVSRCSRLPARIGAACRPASARGLPLLHVSTDEVYGSLGPNDPAFSETTAYQPNSPYSASKAASDHLVRAYHHTYGLPVLTTNCSNNYGPYQFPEKLVPLMIANALAGKPLPVYGDGMNVRDWLYVGDHCAAIRRVLESGRLGETYNIGGNNEMPNIEVVRTVCALLDEMRPDPQGPRERLIAYVKDRPGHDRRYAIDARKIAGELAWQPAETFTTGLRKTVRWYLDNQPWVGRVLSGEYKEWISANYAAR